MSKHILLIFIAYLTASRLAFGFASVTTGKLASEAAFHTLKNGGNAVDAAITASFVTNVTQPQLMGIGGGGFLLIVHQGKSYYFDHREQAPKSAHPKMFIRSDGKAISYPEIITGPNPVGIPGTPLGLFKAHQRFGKLPWSDLLKPAIKLAKDGFPVTEKFEKELAKHWSRISIFPATKALLGDTDGQPLKRGLVLKQPALAHTLETLAQNGGNAFYTGDLSKTWLKEAQELGVKINTDDLKNYKIQDRKPISFNIFGLHALTAPPPSAAGLMVAGTIRFLDHYYKIHPIPSPDSPQRIIVTTEAMKYFQKLRNATIADPPYSLIDPQKFISSDNESKAWKEIENQISILIEKISNKTTSISPKSNKTDSELNNQSLFAGHTSHISTVDDQGTAVSYTTTIEDLFGSGIILPKHGFLLNNELSDFSTDPTHPNAPAPGKRPRSNMSPTILYQQDPSKKMIPVAIIGSAGGPRIPLAVVQVLENYYIHNMSANKAMAFPRFLPIEDKLYLENSFSKATVEALEKASYKLEVQQEPELVVKASALFRRSIRSPWEAAADPRYEGLGLSSDGF